MNISFLTDNEFHAVKWCLCFDFGSDVANQLLSENYADVTRWLYIERVLRNNTAQMYPIDDEQYHSLEKAKDKINMFLDNNFVVGLKQLTY